MRILGIDPGTATTGYGVIDSDEGELRVVAYGVITTPANWEMPHRLVWIYDELCKLIKEHRPDTAAIEQLFFGKNVTTALTVGQARGVLLLALAHAHLPIAEYPPMKIKEAITGYGNADKPQMQMMVRQLLNLEETPRPDDAADGLAIAITHAQYMRYEALVA